MITIQHVPCLYKAGIGAPPMLLTRHLTASENILILNVSVSQLLEVMAYSQTEHYLLTRRDEEEKNRHVDFSIQTLQIKLY